MSTRRRLVGVAAVAALVCLPAYAFANPGGAVCALVHTYSLESGPDGMLVEPAMRAEARAHTSELLAAARSRVAATFGAPHAAPITVVFEDPDAFWPLKVNEYASSNFVGTRSCVLVGPKGQNVDVLAHELVHAELFDRVGFWARLTRVPVWFDEGLAMQVDHRPRYTLPEGAQVEPVRRLAAERDFFSGDDARLTWNYAAAKVEVARWLTGVGASSVYGRFERLRDGEPFDAVLQP